MSFQSCKILLEAAFQQGSTISQAQSQFMTPVPFSLWTGLVNGGRCGCLEELFGIVQTSTCLDTGSSSKFSICSFT